MIPSIRDENGLTLLEVTVVFVLAAIVMVGLVGFYLNSQATWVDGATQAQTQREQTLLVGMMADSIHAADKAVVDPTNHIVRLYSNNSLWYAFWWNPADSLIHGGLGPGLSDNGGLMTSRVTHFDMQSVGDTLVMLDLLEARTAAGQLVSTASSFVAYNR
jgi:type II secretory pathway pseudopilin PulG